MKKIIVAVLVVVIALTMCACGSNNDNAGESGKPSASGTTASNTPSNTATGNKPMSTGTAKESDREVDGYTAKQISTGVYYVEGVTVRIAGGNTASGDAETAWGILKGDAELTGMMDDRYIYLWLRGSDIVGDAECYIYSVELEDKDDPDFGLMPYYNIALTPNGDLYRNVDNMGWGYIGSSDIGFVQPDDPYGGNPYPAYTPKWAGAYDSGSYILEIYDLSDDSIQFTFYNPDGHVMEGGTATFDYNDHFIAYWGESVFTLSADGGAVTVEENGVNGDLMHLRGDYYKTGGYPWFPDAPAETKTADWWGTYYGADYAVGITNYDGDSFWFTIYIPDGEGLIIEGAAAVHSNNPFVAEYGTAMFYLSADSTVLEIDEDTSLNGDFAHLRGEYVRG